MKTLKKSLLVFLVCLVTLWPVTRSLLNATCIAHAAPAAQYRPPFTPR